MPNHSLEQTGEAGQSACKGLIEIAYGFLDNGGFMIIDANSTEDLWDVIHLNPINWAFEYEIEPLIESGHSFKRFFESLEQAE